MINFCISRLQFCALFLGCLVCTFFQGPPFFPAQICAAADGPLDAQVRRPDPRSGSFSPVAPDQIIPGKIYNHFSAVHRRYVWAYAEEGGSFSYALGPGSTEKPDRFDLTTSTSETRELVEAEAGPWAETSRREGSSILVRLGVDEKWSVLPVRSIRSHHDVDSGRRWEWHGKRRVAVLHTSGGSWEYQGGRYVPANGWIVSCCGHDGHCSNTSLAGSDSP